MGLASFLDRLGRTLSGGMLRRLEIATALLNRPQVLFLDEPTVGLDPTARRVVWERLAVLREEAGTTLLVTTHQMEEAERECERIAIMDFGSLVAQGTPEELCEKFGVPDLDEVFSAATGHGIEERRGRSGMSAPAADFQAGSAELRARSLLAGARTACATAPLRWAGPSCASSATTTSTSSPARCSRCSGSSSSAPRCSATASLSGGFHDYRAYLAPGVMAQAALFIAIFFGLAVIWERDVGQLQRLLATPIPRLGIVLGKATGACIRALTQARRAARRARRRPDLDPLEPARTWSARSSCSCSRTGGFACLSMILASLVRTRERFMGIGQLVMMPLFFASSALYPLAIMPQWLRIVARVNPLTYEVHGMRQLLSASRRAGRSGSTSSWVPCFLAVAAVVAARTYPRAIL